MPRLGACQLAIAAALAFAAAGSAASPDAYRRANAKLARATPHFPGATLLIGEAVGGEVGSTAFEAFQRVYAMPRGRSQRIVIGFYRKKLGPAWHQRGAACLVSQRRLVVVFFHPERRRLGLLFDVRGASRCRDLTATLADLLDVGYPDP